MKWTYEEGIQKKTLDDGGGALWRGLLRRYLPFWSFQTVCSPWSMDRKSTLTIFLAWSTLLYNTFDTKQNFSASSFQNRSQINKITSETRFDWILNFVCFFSAFLRRSSLFCADGIRVVGWKWIQQCRFQLSPKETSITPSNLGQIWKSMAVSESARPDDSKTVPESWIWWRFGWDTWGFTQPISSKKNPVIESVAKL